MNPSEDLEIHTGKQVEMCGHADRRNSDDVGERMLRVELAGEKRRFTDEGEPEGGRMRWRIKEDNMIRYRYRCLCI